MHSHFILCLPLPHQLLTDLLGGSEGQAVGCAEDSERVVFLIICFLKPQHPHWPEHPPLPPTTCLHSAAASCLVALPHLHKAPHL